MISEMNTNPEILQKNDKQLTSGNTTEIQPQKQDSAGIFRVGLTKTEALANNSLSSLFTKYNTDNDEVISQNEYDVYSEQELGIKPKSSEPKNDKTETPQLATEQTKTETKHKLQTTQTSSITKTSHLNQTEQTAQVSNASNQPVNSLGMSEKKFEAIIKKSGIDANSTDTKILYEKFSSMTHEQRHELLGELIKQHVDFSKADTTFTNMSIDEMAKALNISEEKWDSADWKNKGSLLAQSMNEKYTADLDETNENSKFNKELQRLKTQGVTDKERELYAGKFDFDNLSENDLKQLAKNSVTQTYMATVLSIAGKNIENGEEENFAIVAKSYMETLFKNNDTLNYIMSMGQEISPEYLLELANKYSETYQANEESDSALESLAIQTVMQNADAEHLATLYQNNANYIDKLNEIAKYVSENTTDETRKAMLNNIVENSEEIASGKTISNSKNSSSGANQTSSLAMTNPIQQNTIQINYINELREASQQYQEQNSRSNVEIPIQYKESFSNVQEYLDFKGTGLTMAEYQRAKSALKNNFTSSMNQLIEKYTNIPDKFKPKILAFFDSMDNNTSGELYLNANEKVRTFMDKYNYMNNQKLLNFVQLHPACINEAPKTVQMQIKELQKEQGVQ